MRRKVYGMSRIDPCPFCGAQALIRNSQGIPVCNKHKDTRLADLKCSCGKPLDGPLQGKWGTYFRCDSCGNISFKKALEMNR